MLLYILYFLFFYFFFSTIFLHFPNFLFKKKKVPFYIHISHRGGSGENVENSMEAFTYCVNKTKTDMIELDVALTKDEQVVVTHDISLKRMTNLNMNVTEINYNDIPLLSNNEKMPLLETVFQNFPTTAINIELKHDSNILIEKVYQLILKYNRKFITIWGSAKENLCNKCYQKDSNIPIYFSFQRVLKLYFFYYIGLLPFIPLKESYLEFPFIPPEFEIFISNYIKNEKYRKIIRKIISRILLSPTLFYHLNKRGICVIAWTLNNEKDFKKAFQLGVNGIMTDFPSKLQNYLEKNKIYIN